MTVMVSKEDKDWLIEQSKTLGVTVSGFIRLLIEDAYTKIFKKEKNQALSPKKFIDAEYPESKDLFA